MMPDQRQILASRWFAPKLDGGDLIEPVLDEFQKPMVDLQPDMGGGGD